MILRSSVVDMAAVRRGAIVFNMGIPLRDTGSVTECRLTRIEFLLL